MTSRRVIMAALLALGAAGGCDDGEPAGQAQPSIGSCLPEEVAAAPPVLQSLAAADGGAGDAGAADAALPDAGAADAGASDAGLPDAGAADGGPGDGGVADAGAADAGLPDAAVADAGAPDAGVGTVEEFDACDGDGQCAPGLDCVTSAFAQTGRFCLRRCVATDDCGFDAFCYPPRPASATFLSMRNHCFFSLCGPAVRNGAPSGACTLGAEAFVNAEAADRRPGTCFAINDGEPDDDADDLGVCLEAGELAAGGACDPGATGRDEGHCAQGTVCAGQGTAGACRGVCDPRATPDPCAVPGEDCADASSAFVDADTGSQVGQTRGLCVAGVRCTLRRAADCPPTAGGHPQRCVPTNPLRESGLCDEAGAGAIAPGGECTADLDAPCAERCDGAVCAPTGAGKAACAPYCDPATAAECAAGEICVTLLFAQDDAGAPIETVGWGICH